MAGTSAFVTSLITNLIIAFIAFLLFSILHSRVSWCFLPRLDDKKRKKYGNEHLTVPPAIGNDFFSWLWPVFTTTDDQLFLSAGLDSFMLIKFFSLCIKFFGLCCLIGLIILIPINATSKGAGSGFDLLSMTNVDQRSNKLWAHFFANVVFSLLAYYFLWKTSKTYIEFRHRWLIENHKQGMMRTLLVEDIPTSYKQNEKFQEFWNTLYENQVHHAVLVENRNDLNDLVEKKKELVKALKHAELVAVTAEEPPQHRPKFWQAKVESIPYYKEQIKILDEKIAEEQKKEIILAPTGLVTFKNSYTASYASRVQQSAEPGTFTSVLAPEPRDIYWPNLLLAHIERIGRTVFMHTLVFFLVFFYTIPVAFVGSLTTLEALSKTNGFGWLGPIVRSSPVVRGLLEGVLPTLALTIFLAILPTVLYFLSKYRGLEAQSWICMSVLNYYFFFQVFNVFLVSLISGSIFDQMSELISSPTSIITLLSTSLPKVANFFINYIMLQAFSGFPLQLLQIGRLIVGSIKLKYFCKTDQDREDAADCPSIDYGDIYPQALLVFMISMAYATIAPLILPFAFIYFVLGYVAYLNMTLYVFVPRYDSGGHFWPMVFSRCIAALVIAQLTLAGLFGIKLAPTQAILSLILPALSVLFYWYISSLYWDKAEFLPLELAVKADKEARSDDSKKQEKDHSKLYIHPAIEYLENEGARRPSTPEETVSYQNAPSDSDIKLNVKESEKEGEKNLGESPSSQTPLIAKLNPASPSLQHT